MQKFDDLISYLNFKAFFALPKRTRTAQTHKSISFIWIVWNTLYVPIPDLGTTKAYFVCHIGTIFQISLIYAFIGCPKLVHVSKV